MVEGRRAALSEQYEHGLQPQWHDAETNIKFGEKERRGD
jgi:hypothetical protein